MARLMTVGLDELELSLQEIAEIPAEWQDRMLKAGAEVVRSAQRRKILEYGIYDPHSTVHVAESLTIGKPKNDDGVRTLDITPTKSRVRGHKKTRNAEILFVNEYGKRGQRARPAIRDANAACAEEMVQAQLAVYNEFLESKNL